MKKGKESSGTDSDASRFDSPATTDPSTVRAVSLEVPGGSNETEADREESEEDETALSYCTALCCASSDRAYQPINK